MLTARNLYIGVMLLGGIALSLASLRWPVIHDGPVPPLMSLLGISLVIDLVVMNRAAAGQMPPLEMNTRFMGFIGGAILYFLLRLALAGEGL